MVPLNFSTCCPHFYDLSENRQWKIVVYLFYTTTLTVFNDEKSCSSEREKYMLAPLLTTALDLLL